MGELNSEGEDGNADREHVAPSTGGAVGEWDTPFPYGHMRAIESAGTVAAPLLAAASFTLIGLIVQNPEKARLPSVALCLLVLAALLFIAAVQCMFWARQWSVTPAEIREWEPTADPKWQFGIQRLHMKGFRMWDRRFSWTYRFGILFLLAGVGVVLVPNGAVSTPRLVAIVIAGLGWLVEALWIASAWLLLTSPVGTWTGEPDEPSADVQFGKLRRSKLARSLARRMAPLVRVDR